MTGAYSTKLPNLRYFTRQPYINIKTLFYVRCYRQLDEVKNDGNICGGRNDRFDDEPLGKKIGDEMIPLYFDA